MARRQTAPGYPTSERPFPGPGQRGAERLLEDILDPNHIVDEAFRMTMVTMKDGRVISGLTLREDGG